MKEKGYVYLIEFLNQNTIKVGMTQCTDPMKRLRCYYGKWKLHFIYYCRNGSAVELENILIKELSMKYKRIKRETFCFSSKMDIDKLLNISHVLICKYEKDNIPTTSHHMVFTEFTTTVHDQTSEIKQISDI